MMQVRLSAITKIYGKARPEGVKAVDNLSLQIHSGEFFVFLGPSGCGKTSTLRMIAGLEQVTAGEIYLDDRLINAVAPGKRNLAMAFESYALYPPLNVYENLAYGLRARRVPAQEIKRRVHEIATLLEMEDILPRFPRHLSGGQQQLVSLARALVRQTPLLLLDEPLSHLEPARRFRVRTALKEFVSEKGITTIYVTHDQLEAMALADRVAVMHRGVLQQVGTPVELWDDPVNKFVAGFIGEPPMNFLSGYLYDSASGRVAAGLPTQDAASTGIEIGMRPQSLRLAGKHAEDCAEAFVFDATVQSAQWLGHESHLFCRADASADSAPIIVVLPPETPLDFQPGSPIRLEVMHTKLYLFQGDGSRIKPTQEATGSRGKH
jgi:multiple sugar transport system ATP-binding protein